MRINCEIRINNRLLPALNMAGSKKGTRSSLAIGKKLGGGNGPPQLFLHICTLQNKEGTKYKILNNIQAVFTKFVEEGKFTIQLKEPTLDLSVKADPVLAKGFLKMLKLVLQKKDIENLPLSHLNPIKTSQIEKPKTKLVISQRKDYPVTSAFPYRLETLIATNIKLNRIEKRIMNLKFLSQIDLSYNQINALPLELANMECLSLLNLAGNNIESVPEKFFEGQLRKTLATLNLSENKIASLPFSIGKLKKLNALSLNNNNLTNLPYSVGRLSMLKQLYLNKNCLINLPMTILHLNLDHLEVHGNPFDATPNVYDRHFIGRVPSLVEIAAISCIKQGLEPQPWDIPYTLCDYLEKYKSCVCGKILFECYIWAISFVALNAIAPSFTSDKTAISVLGYYCSKKCLKRRVGRVF